MGRGGSESDIMIYSESFFCSSSSSESFISFIRWPYLGAFFETKCRLFPLCINNNNNFKIHNRKLWGIQTLILDNKILSPITFGLKPHQGTTTVTVSSQIASDPVLQKEWLITQNQTQIVTTSLRNILFVNMW
jgi:hypothetical protein